MKLSKDFQHHFHELMVEASLSVQEAAEAHKRQLVGEAIRKNNAAAVPVAYSEAALHASRMRINKIIQAYLGALVRLKIDVDDTVEAQMLELIRQLTGAVHGLYLPPAVHPTNVAAVRSEHARAQMRLGSELYRSAANRLREMKMNTQKNVDSGKDDHETMGDQPSETDQLKPKAFISYSWDDEPHKDWVRSFATELRKGGVDVILDRWHLELGADRQAFMEKSVSESDSVLVICTPNYAEKANKRSGGVGYEAMIITPELAANLGTTKFVPILRQGEWEDACPIWLKSRMGANLKGDPYSTVEFSNILKKLHRHDTAPPIGTPPIFIGEPTQPTPDHRPIAASSEKLDHHSGDLGAREMQLLTYAVEDRDGQIAHITTLNGEDLRVNNRHLLMGADTRTVAEWRDALKKLERRGLLEAANSQRTYFRLTGEGFEAADQLTEFAHWQAHAVTVRAHYLNAPSEENTMQCSEIWALPTEYYEYQIRRDSPISRSIKEHRSLLVSLQHEPVFQFQPTEAEFTDISSGEKLNFLIRNAEKIGPRRLRLFIA